jgi:hypothetical protein
VSSFSPVSTHKTSLGVYYDQHPDSAETRVKSKPMTYFSKKNLNAGHLNDSSKDKNIKYNAPTYSPNAMHMSNSLSKSSLRDPKKFTKPHLLKSYKPKKSTDSTSSRAGTMKYTTNYSSKRPKSAKSVGNYIKASKYRRQDNHPSVSIYKNYKGDSTSHSKAHGSHKVMFLANYYISLKTL